MSPGYHFAGHQRFSLPAADPNQCAALAGMAAVLAAGYAASTWRRRHPARIGPPLRSVAAVAVLAAQLLAVSLTYSRGGYLGTTAGFAALALSSAGLRRWATASIAALWILILAVPAGADRVCTLAAVHADPSLRHRLILWRGSLAMLHDRWSGVGLRDFRDFYAAWYQPAAMREFYRVPLGDVLAIGCVWGVASLWGYLCALFGLIGAGIAAMRVRPTIAVACGVSAVVAYEVAALFSTFVNRPAVELPFAVVAAFLAIVLFREWRRGPFEVRIPVAVGAVAAAVVVVAIFCVAGSLARTFPYRPRYVEGRADPPGLVREASPRNARAKGTVFVLLESPRSIGVARWLLRPLATSGYRVAALLPPDSGLQGADACAAILKALSRDCPPPHFLVGLGDAGRFALDPDVVKSADAKAVATFGCPAWWPIPEISPLDTVGRLHVPLLIVHGRDDRRVDVGEADSLFRSAKRHGSAVSLAILRSRGHFPPDGDFDLARIVARFFASR